MILPAHNGWGKSADEDSRCYTHHLRNHTSRVLALCWTVSLDKLDAHN